MGYSLEDDGVKLKALLLYPNREGRFKQTLGPAVNKAGRWPCLRRFVIIAAAGKIPCPKEKAS
jgi:hypothetical protein